MEVNVIQKKKLNQTKKYSTGENNSSIIDPLKEKEPLITAMAERLAEK